MQSIKCFIYITIAGLVDTIGAYGIKVDSGNEIDAILNLNKGKDQLKKNGKNMF